MKGFMFYNHFGKVITRLNLEEKGRFLDCLLNYYKDGIEPPIDTPIVVDIAFKAVQSDIDRYIKSCTSKMKKKTPDVDLVKKEVETYDSPFVKQKGE